MKGCAMPAHSAALGAISASFLRRMVQSQTTRLMSLRSLHNFAFKCKDASLKSPLLAFRRMVGP